MSAFSLRVPTGFVVALGNLCDLDDKSLLGASSQDIEARNLGEDLAVFDHLVLDASVHLDARRDAFHVSVLSGDSGDMRLERTSSTFGAAVRDLEKVLDDIWRLDVAWRKAETTYRIEPHGDSSAETRDLTWILPGGWTVLIDRLSTRREAVDSAGAEMMQLLFVATSSHRSIAVYETPHVEAHPPFAGFLWADPIGRMYERVFFRDREGLVSWLRARVRQEALPPRRSRR